MSKYEFWLTQDKDKLRLPVLPEKIEVGNRSSNETVSISGLGEITIPQDPNLKEYAFESFFPINDGPFVEYKGFLKPWDIVKKIEEWKNNGNTTRFMITGTAINTPVTIEDFAYMEQGGAVGEIKYSLSLKEYRFVTVRKIKVQNPKPKPKRPNPKSNSKVHVVKRGDTLWGLARKYYGNGAQWKKIWNVKSNKDMMIKRDKRNLKQPGHWIHIGQRIVIPS